MDNLTEMVAYCCEPSSVEEFTDVFWRTIDGSPTSNIKLRKITCQISEEQIPAESIRTLWIIGTADICCNNALKAAKLHPGIYINQSCDQLLLIHLDESAIQSCIDHHGHQITAMNLSFTTLSNLDLSALVSVVRFFIQHDACLSTIKGLEHMEQLLEFEVVKCENLKLLDGLDNLSQLAKLSLSECVSLEQLPNFEKLTLLKELSLFECSSLTQLTGIEASTLLTKLTIARCTRLIKLPNLENLKQLRELSLSECVSLPQINGIEALSQLTRLTLFKCKSLQQLPDLARLSALTELSLAQCSYLREIPNLEKLTQLTRLSLSGCKNLREIPDGIRNLKSLRTLVLRNLCLRKLPNWLPEIAESFSMEVGGWRRGENKAIIFLHGTSVEDTTDMSIFDKSYEIVVDYFEKRKQGELQSLNEIKVVFLGDGEAGKSHTIARLMNDGGAPEGYVDVRTPGIVIKDLHQPVEGRDTTLHLWDFGGQDIMHSMHRIFLTERTLYVVLVDGSIGNQDERARYWLQNIQSFAKDAPVLLVLNKLDDDLQADVNAVDLRDKYRGLKRILKLSALQYSKERFNREFRDVLLEEVAKTGYLDVQWPKAWVRVKNELEQMKPNYIHGEDYLRICDECCVDNNRKELLKWFHDLGISFCYCDGEYEAMEDYVVLKPNWITNALYIILFNEREGGNGGLVPIHTIRTMLGRNAPNKETIKRVIPDAYYMGYDVNYVLDVFHAFRLSFQTDEHHEFFPMLADVNARPVAKEYAEDATCLEFNMEFDYLPNNLLHRLMVERQAEMDMDNVWRTGAMFELKELGLSTVVIIDGNTLKFFISHKNENHRPNTYLTMLKANVDRIVKSMGLKAPTNILTYKVYGKSVKFSYDRLLKMSAKGRKMEFCEDLEEDFLIQDILNQSAPDDQVEEHKLLKTILQVCGQIQREPECWGTKEDVRNRRMRDALEIAKYDVHDQTQLGISGSKKDVGELDLMLYRGNQIPWSIIEALRIYDGSKGDWNTHLEKVLDNYNPHGVPFLFLVTYADCEKKRFDGIWEGYENHIQNHHSGEFAYVDQSYELLTGLLNNHYLQIAKTRYRCGEYTPTVYHIFVQMNPKREVAVE